MNALNEDEESALHLAVQTNSTNSAAFLVASGADVNTCDEYKRTPLHSAAKLGNTEVARILVGKGAHVNACTNEGYS